MTSLPALFRQTRTGRAPRFPPPRCRPYSLSCPNPLPATFLRGGTSKGIFINREHLPSDPSEWRHIFLGIMGSPDPEYGRQLNGMGGGVSSLSKICVVGRPTEEQQSQGIEVEYTFVQVSIKDDSIDLAGNCGNLSSVVGAFAVDEGIYQPHRLANSPSHPERRITVRSLNTNTGKIIDTTFPIVQTKFGFVSNLGRPETRIAGVSGKASKIVMDFVNPAGARTGKLLPTGSPLNSVTLSHVAQGGYSVDVSLVDATNPTIFVSYSQLAQQFPINDYIYHQEPALTSVSDVLETIRQHGAKLLGMDPTALSQPKIALLSQPSPNDQEQGVDVVIHALSMGVLHKAVPMTVGLCLGVAVNVKGSLAWHIVQQSRVQSRSQLRDEPGLVRIKHPTGIVDVGAEFSDDGEVKSAKVVRTGRKLMQGVVWW